MTPSALPDLRHDPAHLRGLLGDARAQLAHASDGVEVLGLALSYLSRRAAPTPVCDLACERRLLGGLLHPREEVSDATAAEVLFEGLAPLDLLGPGHASILACALSLLELGRQPTRSLVGDALRLAGVGPLPVFRVLPDADEALDALDLLPWPATAPLRELYTVGALARWRRG